MRWSANFVVGALVFWGASSAVAQPAEQPGVPEEAGSERDQSLGQTENRQDGEGETDSSVSLRRIGTERVRADALPFRNSAISYENAVATRSFRRDQEASYDPYYGMSLSLRPRWYFTDALSARLRFDVEVELTNANDTTRYREPVISDLYLDLVYDPIVTIPVVEVGVGAGVRFTVPTSLASRAETRYLGIGPELRLSRVFDVLDGLSLGYSFRYTKFINGQTSLRRESNPYPARFISGPEDDPYAFNDAYAGSADALDSEPTMALSQGFVNGLTLQLSFLESWRPMSATAMVSFTNSFAYRAPEATVPIIGGQEVTVEHIDDPVNHRASIWYVLELGIEITDYLSASLGVSTLSGQLKPDSTYRAPFFNRFTNLYVDLSLDIERVVAQIRRAR